MSFLDEEERYRINVFDWNAEFPEIMKAVAVPQAHFVLRLADMAQVADYHLAAGTAAMARPGPSRGGLRRSPIRSR